MLDKFFSKRLKSGTIKRLRQTGSQIPVSGYVKVVLVLLMEEHARPDKMYLQTFWSLFVLLFFYQFDVYDTSTCGENFGGQSGLIQYSSSSKESANISECIFLITGSPGVRITLNFIDFNFPDKYLDKCIDYLKIQDGAQEDAPTLVTLCGSGDSVQSQRTSQNNMRITAVTNSTRNATFRASYTSASIPDHLLLMTSLNSNGKVIARLDLDVYSSVVIPVQDVGTPLAVDFDPMEGRIYWTDNSTASIKSAFLNGSDSRVVYTSHPDLGPERRGLAVDHLSRLIFYTDLNNGVIGMLSIGQCFAKLIVSTDLRRPHGIALDMINGVLFWTDVGDSPRIERANYDGSERRAIATTSLGLPYAVTLDMSQNTLYWVDAGFDRIEKSDLVGSRRTLVYTLQGSHFYGLAFNRGFLYVTNHSPFLSNSTGVLSFIHKVNAATETLLTWSSTGLMSYAECYDEKNVIAGPNGCSSSTNCPYICIPAANKGSKCLQPDYASCVVSLPGCGGYFTTPSGTLTSPRYPRNYTGNLDCIYYIVQPATYRITLTFKPFDIHQTPECADDFLEILDGDKSTSPVIGVRLCGKEVDPPAQRSTENAIRIRFKTNGDNSGTGFSINYTAEPIPKSFLLFVDSGPTVFRMDPEVFSYTRLPFQNLRSPVAIDYDPEEDRVYWTDSSTKEIRSAFFNGADNQLIFSLHADASCEGLAIDYLSRLVFYTDSGNDVIGSVSITSLNQQTVINSELDEPGAITLHLTKRFIFWVDSGNSPKLERANYDGSERRVLLTLSSSQSEPTGLALDFKNDLLYWADAASGRIERTDLQGGNRKPVFSLPQSRFFALALGGDYIFVTNFVNSSLSIVLRIRLDASESTYMGWSTTSTLKGLCLYNEATRLRAENHTNITSSNVGLIAGVTGGCLAGLVIVISVVIFVMKRRAGDRTPPVAREVPQGPVEWKARSSTSSQVSLGKAVDYGDGDYGEYCELDDVQQQYSSGERYVSLNLYITPRPDYKDPATPPPPSCSGPRSSRQDSINLKI